MTFTVTPFALQNASHSAEVFRQAVSSLVPPGGCLVTAGDLTVSQTGTPSMNVSVGVGRIWIPGTNVGNVTGGNFSSQAMYYGQNDAAQTVSVTTSDPINPRIDVVYAAIEDSQYAGTSNAGKLAVVAGVPTSDASYPANAPAVPNNAKAIAWVKVNANAASIVAADITNLKLPHLNPLPFLHQEFTYNTPAAAIPNATTWGPGTLTADTTPITTDSALATTPADDRLTIAKAGTYMIWFGGAFGHGLTGESWFQIKKGDDTEVYASAPASGFWGSVDIPAFRILADNTTLWFRLKQTSGNATNSTGRIRLTRIS